MTCCSQCNRYKDSVCTCAEDKNKCDYPSCKERLRDEFARAAMQSLIINPKIMPDDNENIIAQCAYKQADAMLKEREESKCQNAQ